MQKLALIDQNVTGGRVYVLTPKNSPRLRRQRYGRREIVMGSQNLQIGGETYQASKPWIPTGEPSEPSIPRGFITKQIFGDQMSPVIRPGSSIILKEVNWRSFVEFGRIHYIVATDGRAYLRYLRLDPENPVDYFELHAANCHYDEFSIPKSRIQSVWAYHGHFTGVLL